MVEQIFTQEAVEKLQPYIQKTVDDLLEDLKQRAVPTAQSISSRYLHSQRPPTSSTQSLGHPSMTWSILHNRMPFVQTEVPQLESRLLPTSQELLDYVTNLADK
ncbi:hypothetical protein NW765_017251 [Fusarium oxysporum]|nr:hypothetical protein NW765_017251 [Fusarium oxysporum]